MPVIRIDYDNQKVKDEDVKALSEATREIVIEVTGIGDVFVYANSSQIKVGIHLIEIFVEVSAHKVPNPDKTIAEIKSQLSEWKKKAEFRHLINLTLSPMQWKIEIGI